VTTVIDAIAKQGTTGGKAESVGPIEKAQVSVSAKIVGEQWSMRTMVNSV